MSAIFLKGLAGSVTLIPPIWFMRQAGRYLPEYREVRGSVAGFIELCYNPILAAEVTLQPVRRFGLDAAILFSDILLLPQAMGVDLTFIEGEGPRLNPTSPDQLSRLSVKGIDEKLNPIFNTVALVKSQLGDDKALIGFAGSPWTVACYMAEGKGGGGFPRSVKWSNDDPASFIHLLDIITQATIEYLLGQIKAGADVIQLFDSWAGLVEEKHFEEYVITPTHKIVEGVRKIHPHIPIIGFPRGVGIECAVQYAKTSGVTALSVDCETSLAKVAGQLPPNFPLQGNLSPELLLKGGQAMFDATKMILETMMGRPFIFNLGHGILPQTPPSHVAELVSFIRERK